MVSLCYVLVISLFWMFCDTLPPYIPGISAGLQNDCDSCVIGYFNLGFRYAESLGFLGVVHGIHLSHRQRKRILHKKGLKKRQAIQDPENLISAIEHEISTSGGGGGGVIGLSSDAAETQT